MSPARAPASMDMLQTVRRPSMDSDRMASPRYSMTYPWPPPVPICAMIARIRSFAVTPDGSAPDTLTAIVFGLICGSVWVASTCSTSLVPMPNASAPTAPCVDVCESPQTIVIPGWVSPSCGTMTCTIPCPASPIGCSRTPNSAAFLRSASTCVRETGSVTGEVGPVSGTPGPVIPVVGTLWSSVAIVRSGRRTFRPAARSPSNASGVAKPIAKDNIAPTLEVIELHRCAVHQISDAKEFAHLKEEAANTWDDAADLGKRHGYRNAQVTVLAPTGTISFLMDCDTTGIEPDIALVKYKLLAGGGMLKIVNQTIKPALEKLGYGSD